MKKKITLLLTALNVFFGVQLYSQSTVWKFGNFGGLKFNADGTTSLHPASSSNSSMGATGVTDINGNVMFYTDGKNLWDGTNNLVSTSLQTTLSSTQAPVIVPVPGKCNKFMVFSVGPYGATQQIYINMVAVSGTTPPYGISNSFAPVVENISSNAADRSSTIPDNADKIAAISDENSSNPGYWIVTHDYSTSGDASYFTAMHMTRDNMVPCNYGSEVVPVLVNSKVWSHGDLSHTGGLNRANAKGQMKFNKAGTKLALVLGESRQIEISSFNKTTGDVIPLKILTLPSAITDLGNPNAYGIEFSPDGLFLYITEGFHASSGVPKRVFQVNYNATTPTFTVITQTNAVSANENTYNALQLGPDDKIYLSGPREGNNKLSVISNPNNAGNASFYSANTVSISGTNKTGLPATIPNYIFQKVTIAPTSVSNCSPQNTVLTASGGVTYLWMPGNKTTASITVNPTTTTTYTVTSTLASGCTSTATVKVSIGIGTTAPVITATAYKLCPGTTSSLLSVLPSTQFNGANYQWQTVACDGVTATNIAGATSATYAAPYTSAFYRLRVGCGVNYVYSNIILITQGVNCTIAVSPCSAGPGGGGGGCADCRTTTTTGVEEEQGLQETLKLYPNPNNGQFTIALTSATDNEAVVTIVDVFGREIIKQNHSFNKGENQLQIQMENYPKGVYFVRVQSAVKQLQLKMIYQ